MFKIPEWGEDIPKNNDYFISQKIKKKRKEKAIETPKDNPREINIKKSKVNRHKYTINDNNKVKHKNKRYPAGKINKIENKANKKKKAKKLSHNIVETKKLKHRESDVKLQEKEIQNGDIVKHDEILLNAQKKKLNENSEEPLFNDQETNKSKIKPTNYNNVKSSKITNGDQTISKTSQMAKPKYNKKKQLIKSMLENFNHRNHISVSGNQLRERMLDRLKAAQFRYLNEKLYTSSGSEAQNLFKADPIAFQTYHQGYQQQVKKWPVNPLDIVVQKIIKMPSSHLIADMGCGEAALSKRVPNQVRSFDLVADSEGVEACDMAHTPLLSSSVDVTVYCLALMGTDLTQYLVEANRVLKVGGHLLIAEVESRFDDADAFAKEVQRLGFKLKELDKSHKVFFFMHFTKTQQPPAKKSKLPELTLKPCLYKRR